MFFIKSSERIIVTWTICLALSIISIHISTAAQDIFVLSDIYSIKPDGTCYETADGKLGERVAKNCHWDSTSKTIRMFAARNEEVAVQIVVPEKGEGFHAEVSELKGPGVIPPDRATFSMLAWATSKNGPSLPDLVIPLDGSVAGIKAVDVPIAVRGLPQANNTVGVILFEVWVPKDAKAGGYSGSLRVLKGEQLLDTLQVNLTVLDLDFPDRPTLAFDLGGYDMPSNAKAFVEPWVLDSGNGVPLKATKASERVKRTNHQVYKLTLDNRCFLNIMTYSGQRGNPTFAYPVEGQGSAAKISSYTEFDEFFGPVLEGKLNKFGRAPAYFYLPFNVNYPHVCNSDPQKQFNWQPFNNKMPAGPGDNPALKEFEETNKAIAEQTFKHFAEMGWKDTSYVFFHNQKGDESSSGKSRKGTRNTLGTWSLDEPVRKSDYEALHYLLTVNRWSAESSRSLGIQTINRLDIGHWHCDKMVDAKNHLVIGHNNKEYDKVAAKDILQPVVDLWMINTVHLDGALSLVKDYKKPGVTVMNYTGPGKDLERNNCADRGEGYRAARRGVDGVDIYKVDLNAGNPNSYPDSEFTLYCGASVNFDGALCSKRLKHWRSAVNDYEYYTLARKKNAEAADEIVHQMTAAGSAGSKNQNIFSIYPTNNPEDFLASRLALAGIALGQKLAGSQISGRSKDYSPCSAEDHITGYD
jgi:hypothetical protein